MRMARYNDMSRVPCSLRTATMTIFSALQRSQFYNLVNRRLNFAAEASIFSAYLCQARHDSRGLLSANDFWTLIVLKRKHSVISKNGGNPQQCHKIVGHVCLFGIVSYVLLPRSFDCVYDHDPIGNALSELGTYVCLRLSHYFILHIASLAIRVA